MRFVCKVGLICAQCSLVLNASAYAADWALSKGVATSAEYIEQDDLLDDATQDVTRSNATITPFVSLTATGRRSSLNLNARVTATASSDSDETDVRPQLSAVSRVYSEGKQLRFDSSASIQQRTVDSPFIDDEDLFNSSTRERVISLSVGPSYQQRFGRSLIGVSYLLGASTSSETDDSRSVVQTAEFESRSLPFNTQLVIGSQISAQHTAFDSDPSASSGIAFIFAEYPLRKNLLGTFAIGRDFIEIDDNLADLDGTAWGGVLDWQPNSRLNVNASYAERSFGRQPALAISLLGRRSSVELSLTRTLGIFAGSNATSIFSGTLDSEINGSPDGGNIGGTQGGGFVPPSVPLFQESNNINDRIRLSYSLFGRVSIATVSVSGIQQDDLITAESSKSRLLELSLTRKFSLSSTVVLSAATGRTEQDNQDDMGVNSDEEVTRVALSWRVLL